MSPSNYHVVEHKVPCQHIREYPAATADSQEDVLYLLVKQYIPVDNPHPQPGDVTIIASPANALPKEVYEPLWDDIYVCCQSQGLRIRSIWIADAAYQGQSGLINQGHLGNDPCAFDHSRDLLHFINLKRADMPRPIVAIGHSIGAIALVRLSLIHPRLFHTMILLDPVILRGSTPLANGDVFDHKVLLEGYIGPSTFRRETWPSRQEAAKSFRRSTFFKPWDPRVLDRWIQYGLCNVSASDGSSHGNQDTPGPVKLTTAVSQEIVMCGRPYYNRPVQDRPPNHPANHVTHPDMDPSLLTSFPFYRPEPTATFHQLPFVRPSVLYIFGGKSQVGMPELRAEKLATTGIGVGGSGGVPAGRVREVFFPQLGHLIGLEGVTECADAAVRWLGEEMRRWEEEERLFYSIWDQKSRQEKAMVDREWREKTGRRQRRRRSGGGEHGESAKL